MWVIHSHAVELYHLFNTHNKGSTGFTSGECLGHWTHYHVHVHMHTPHKLSPKDFKPKSLLTEVAMLADVEMLTRTLCVPLGESLFPVYACKRKRGSKEDIRGHLG